MSKNQVSNISNSVNSALKYIPALLAAIAILIYSPSVNYDFVYDDNAVLNENQFVLQGFGGLKNIWTTSYFKGFDENINARAFRPISLTMFAIENQFFGLNPKVHHSISVFVFGLTAAFLFLFLSRLWSKHSIILALFTTLLFVAHPIHIEVVANLKSRDELMALLFFFIASWTLLKSIDQKEKKWLPLSWLAYAIALFSKESALTTLAIIPLFLWFFRTLSLKNIIVKTLPYFILASIFLLVRTNILGGINEGVRLTFLDNSLLAATSVSERISSNIYVLGIYFFKNIWPSPLLSDYSYNTIPLVGWIDYRTISSLFLYILLVGAAIFGFIKKEIYSFGILYFLITVSIFSSIVVLNVNAYADRFNYSPSLGVCILIAWLFSNFLKNEETIFSKEFFIKNLIPLSIFGLIISVAIFKTKSHLPVWKNRYTLFAHDVKIAPQNARMLKNYGGSLARLAMAETDPTKRQQLAKEAIEYLEKSLEIYNRMSTGFVHLGNMYGLIGDYDRAGNAFEKGLQIDPKSYTAHTNLANVYYRKGRYADALDLMLQINFSLYSKNDYYLLSIIYGKLGKETEAAKYRQLSGR